MQEIKEEVSGNKIDYVDALVVAIYVYCVYLVVVVGGVGGGGGGFVVAVVIVVDE